VDEAFCFAPFQLFPSQRTLLKDGVAVHLGSRALDLLIDLVRHAGMVMSKAELMGRVWRDVVVDETSLRTHVASLRRALGDGQGGRRYIVNVPGRGYSFVAAVSSSRGQAPGGAEPAGPVGVHDLPGSPARMIGRADIVESLAEVLPRRRFITIVGPGGIGKTTVALAVANRLAPTYANSVKFVDLAPITDMNLVSRTVATGLGLTRLSGDLETALVAQLRDKRMLLILDSLEHVVEGAAPLAEAIFKGAPGVNILATSREPLRAEGEWLRRLPALALAPPSATISACEALEFPSVELFVERAAAKLDTFELTDSNAPVVAEICHKLDGIPLAIELAAGRIDTFGVAGLAAALADRFKPMTGGRRTALPRHRTMNATLDWSYQWLTAAEQATLRRLAVFVGGFALEAVLAVLADIALIEDPVEELADLVDKSLVTADIDGSRVHYRLLATTRTYGLEKLAEGGEVVDASRRHAEYCLKLLEASEADWVSLPASEWLSRYGRQTDNLRTALDWAFSPAGAASIGIALTIAAAPLWFQQSLVEECRRWVELALTRSIDPRRQMQLLAIQGWALHEAGSRVGAERIEDLSSILDLAIAQGDDDHRALALWGLWANSIVIGKKRQAREHALEFQALATAMDDTNYLAVSDRMLATLTFYAGDFTRAEGHLEQFRGRRTSPGARAPLIRQRMEQYRLDRSLQALVAFLRGFLDQALKAEDDNFAQSLRTENALSQINSLCQSSCLVALYFGDISRSERFVRHVVELSDSHGFKTGSLVGRCYESILLTLQGDHADEVPRLRTATDALRKLGYINFFPIFLGNLAERLGEAGRFDEGFSAITEASEVAEAMDEQWCLAEFARIRGRLSFMAGMASDAKRDLVEAVDLARRQGALFWELRAARNLAELRQAEGRASDGRDILSATCGRFTEGFDSADMRAARRLLDDLAR